MKLLIVLSIKEHQERVANLLQNAGVAKFSVADITGYKKDRKALGGLQIQIMPKPILSCCLASPLKR